MKEITLRDIIISSNNLFMAAIYTEVPLVQAKKFLSSLEENDPSYKKISEFIKNKEAEFSQITKTRSKKSDKTGKFSLDTEIKPLYLKQVDATIVFKQGEKFYDLLKGGKQIDINRRKKKK